MVTKILLIAATFAADAIKTCRMMGEHGAREQRIEQMGTHMCARLI
jgi:hypothetical protein